jgi:hypothetical protein
MVAHDAANSGAKAHPTSVVYAALEGRSSTVTAKSVEALWMFLATVETYSAGYAHGDAYDFV